MPKKLKEDGQNIASYGNYVAIPQLKLWKSVVSTVKHRLRVSELNE
jgi:hypothetical protein